MSDFLWKLLQFGIVAGVICWLIYEKAPGGGLAYGVFALGVAWLLTIFPFWLIGKTRRGWRRGKARILARYHAPEQNIDLLGPHR